MNPQNIPGQHVPRELLLGRVAMALLAARNYRLAALQAAAQQAARGAQQAAGAALMAMHAAGQQAAGAAQAAVQAAGNAAPPVATDLQRAVSVLQPFAVGIYAADRFLGALDSALTAQSQGHILPLPDTKLGWARLLVSGGAALLSLAVHAPEVQPEPEPEQAAGHGLHNPQAQAPQAGAGAPANHQQHPWQLILAPGPLANALANNRDPNHALWDPPAPIHAPIGLLFHRALWHPPPPALIMGGCTAAGVALAVAGRLWAQHPAGGESKVTMTASGSESPLQRQVAAGMATAGQHLVRFSLPALAAAMGATEGYARSSPLLALPTHTQWGAWAFLVVLPLQLWELAGPTQRVWARLQG